MRESDINAVFAAGRGWSIRDIMRAEKGGTVLFGDSTEDLMERIEEFERHNEVREQEEREQIDRLLRRVRVLAGEPFSARTTDQLAEAVKQLLAQPQEILDAHEEYVAWRERVKRGLAEFEAQQAA
jgi:hypothetical protein